MKKKILSLIMILAMMFSLVACTPNMKAYVAEANKVAEWKGYDVDAKAEMKVSMQDEKNGTMTFSVPMTIKGKSSKDMAELVMNLNVKSIKELAAKEGEDVKSVPDSIEFKVVTDGKKVYIAKEVFIKLLGDDVPKAIKEAKEEYIALDTQFATAPIPVAASEKANTGNMDMKYLQSAEFKSDVMKIFDAAFADYKPVVDFKVEGNKFSYEATIDELTKEAVNVASTIAKNWEKTEPTLTPVLNKMGIKVVKEDLNKGMSEFKKDEFEKSAEQVKETLKGSKVKYNVEFKENSFVQNYDITFNIDKVMKMEMKIQETDTKLESVNIAIPTSVKNMTMEEYVNLFMPESKETAILVAYNGEMIEFEDQEPVIKNDRTLVPFRALLEKMGAEVKWDAVTKKVTAVKDGKEIILEIGNKTAVVDGKKVEMDVPAQILNDRTMIPLRFVSENLGYKVKFDNSTKGLYLIDIYNISDEELANKIKGDSKN
ncbi:copper amine oxidase N-terminal domain-containing protein [Peptoniphilus sp. oral taxon 386]|uniref:copper amine oxidase N-terminal domain-containing protein n=1 Tax=Peptoniphilus sp. oral taxon 386 TaxID=652713 RepID=UPI001145CEB3|nr:copper amine oxidase N-terminal domain-containing protein [Peptoniphilus sp. oral taxon 386]